MEAGGTVRFMYSGKERTFTPSRIYSNPKNGLTNVVGFLDVDGEMEERTFSIDKISPMPSESKTPSGISPEFESEFDSMFEVPDGAHKVDIYSMYEPRGRTDETSEDYTDDPSELSTRFSQEELAKALREAVMPSESGDRAEGLGNLEFSDGDETVPAEALYEALQMSGVDADIILAGIYDSAFDDPNRVSNVERLQEFKGDMFDSPEYSPARSEIPQTQGEADRVTAQKAQRTGQSLDNERAQRAVELMRSHEETNPKIKEIADQIIFGRSDDPVLSFDEAFERFYPLSKSDDPADREAFRAFWGIVMSIDGGDGGDLAEPDVISPEDSRMRMLGAISNILERDGVDGDIASIAEDAYYEMIEEYGQYADYINGKKAISSGSDDLSADTTAAAFYRIVSSAASPNNRPLYRVLNIHKDNPEIETLLTEGSTFSMDARPFTAQEIADGSLMSRLFFPTGVNERRIVLEVPPGEIDSLNVSDMSFVPDEQEWIGFGELQVVSVREQSNEFGVETIVQVRRADAAAPEAPSAATAYDPDADDIETWSRTGGQAGSNPGGFYETPDGRRYYVKSPRSQSHAENEVLASAFYEMLGVPAARVRLGREDGDTRIVSTLIEDADTGDFEFRVDGGDTEYLDKVRQGFVADAWLANWDSVGLVYDNIVTDGNGDPVRLDPGGSLMYRARGAEKGSAFGNNVTELDTLRDPDLNPQAASVFGDIDDATLQAAAKRLRDITPSQIDETVDSIVSDPDDAALLKERLKARRQSILDRFGIQEGQDDPDLFPDPEPLTDAMGYQAQDLVPGDITATDSFVVEKVFRDSETPKGKVSIQGYYPGHESQRKEWNEDTEIEVSRGGTTPPKGDKPALHRPKRPYSPRSQETFSGDMRDLLEGAESWEEVAEIIRGTEIVYFDYETTGIGDGELNRPVQIGAVRIVNGEVVDRFNMYMNPEFRLSDWSKENLKREDGELVTDEWLETQPSMREAHERFIEFVGDRPILGGQNVPFDTEVLQRTLGEQGLELEIGGTIDSLPMARGTLPTWSSGSPDGPSQVGRDGKRRSSNSLGPVAEYLGVELGNWHRADADAEAAWDITDAMLTRASAPDADVSTESFDGREAEKIAQDRAEYDAAMSVYKDELADYEAAKAVAAAWNCGGAGITAAVGDGEGPCDVPDPDDMINNATPDESIVDPEGVPGGATDSNVSMADALDDGVVERPEKDGVNVKDPYADEKFPPTAQQRDVVDAVLTGENVVVRALAGTGKTSTLKLIARRLKKEQPKKRIAYVAFNKSIQLEADATMPGNVESRTGDSIAWRAIGSSLTDKRKKNRFNNKPSKLANDLGITGQPSPDEPDKDMTATQVYRAINKAVTNYTISADDEIGPQHFEFDNVPDEWIAKAGEIWDDLKSPSGVLPFNNNHATKIWALSRPDLSADGSGLDYKADVIFFDEAQDINPVIGKVIADQTAQVVYVGDGNQAIYGFRGAEDELQKISAPNDLPLTKSWRFGPQIAGIGNRFLAALGSDYRIEGGGPDGKILPRGGMPDADAVLVRSNAGAVREIYRELEAGRKVGVTKSFKEDLERFVRHADWLKSGARLDDRPQMHEDLAPFSSWDEVVKSLEDEDNKKLEFLVDLVDSEGVDGLYDMLGRLIPYTTNADVSSDELPSAPPLMPSEVASGSSGEVANGVMFEVSGDRVKLSGKTFDTKESIKALGFKWNAADKSWVRSIKGDDNRARTLNELRSKLAGDGSADRPDVVVSTAHRAKGLEWDRVRIGDDFRGPRVDGETGATIMPADEELRLAYVAVTRAQKQLDPGSLEYIYGYTTEADESPNLPSAPEADVPEAPEAPEAPPVPVEIDPERRAAEVAKYNLEDLGEGELDAVGSENSYIRQMFSDTWEAWVDGQSIGTAPTQEEIVEMYNERVGEVVDSRLSASEEVAETRDEVAPGGTPESPEALEGDMPLPPPSPDEAPVDTSGAIIEEVAFDPKTQKTFGDDLSEATDDLEMVKDDIYSKGSTGKKFKDALQRAIDAISDYTDGKISLSEAVSRLRNEEDGLDEFSTSTGKTKLDYDFAHGSVRDARRILDGSVYGPAEIGKGLPPEGSGLGFSKDGVFIKPGMRVRDKWGYAGTVVRYNESGGYVNVYILKDIDHRDPDKLGEKAKKSYGPKKYIDSKGTTALTVIKDGDDNSPWIDSGKVPEGKKPKNLDSQLEELRKMGDDDGEGPMGVEPPSPKPDDSGDSGEAPAGTTEALRENVEDNRRDDAWTGEESDRPESPGTDVAQASKNITEALRDSENPEYTADDETIKDLLREEIGQTSPDDTFITISPPSGFETTIRRSDAIAVVGDSPKVDAPEGAPNNDALAEEKQLKERIKVFEAKGGLTREEAEEYVALSKRINELRFDRRKDAKASVEDVADAAERLSTLSPETNLAAYKDLFKNKGVYTAIKSAASGVFFNADTDVDKIMDGDDPETSPQDFYDAFKATREALRSQYGDTVPLFRAVGAQKKKSTTNWATTREFVEQFGDNVVEELVPVERIAAVHVTRNGKYHEVIVLDEDYDISDLVDSPTVDAESEVSEKIKNFEPDDVLYSDDDELTSEFELAGFLQSRDVADRTISLLEEYLENNSKEENEYLDDLVDVLSNALQDDDNIGLKDVVSERIEFAESDDVKKKEALRALVAFLTFFDGGILDGYGTTERYLGGALSKIDKPSSMKDVVKFAQENKLPVSYGDLLRSQLKLVQGEEQIGGEEPSVAGAFFRLLTRLSESSPYSGKMYRGIVNNESTEDFITEGSTVTIPPRSFSKDVETSEEFGDIILEVDGEDAIGVDVSELSTWDEGEVIAYGSFKVDSVEDRGDGSYYVKLVKSQKSESLEEKVKSLEENTQDTETSDVDSPVDGDDSDAGEFSDSERAIIEGAGFEPGSVEDASYRISALRIIDSQREEQGKSQSDFTEQKVQLFIENIAKAVSEKHDTYSESPSKELARDYYSIASDEWLDANLVDARHPRPTREIVVKALESLNPFRVGSPHHIAWSRVLNSQLEETYDNAGILPDYEGRLTTPQTNKVFYFIEGDLKAKVESGKWRKYIEDADPEWVEQNINSSGEISNQKSIYPLQKATYKGVEFSQIDDDVWVAESFIDRYDVNVDDPDVLLPMFIPMGDGGADSAGEGYFFSAEKQRFWGRYGAGGALISFVDDDGEVKYVLGKRATWIPGGGGKWGLPGGAHRNRRNAEDPRTTAIEETAEEIGISINALTVPDFIHENDVTQDWRYSTVGFTVSAEDAKSAKISDNETSEIKFFTADELLRMVGTGELHPSLDEFMPELLERHSEALRARAETAKMSKNFTDYSNEDPFEVDEISEVLAKEYRQIFDEQGIPETVMGNTMAVVAAVRHAYSSEIDKSERGYLGELARIRDILNFARVAAVDINYNRRPDTPDGDAKPYNGAIETQTLAMISQGDVVGASIYLHAAIGEATDPEVRAVLGEFKNALINGRFKDIEVKDDWTISKKNQSSIGKNAVGGKDSWVAVATTLRESIESIKRIMADNPEAARKVSKLFMSDPALAARVAASRFLGPGRELREDVDVLPLTSSAFDDVPSMTEAISIANSADKKSIATSTLFDGSDIEDGEVEISRVKRNFSDKVKTQMSFKLTAWAAERLTAVAKQRARDDDSGWSVSTSTGTDRMRNTVIGYALYNTFIQVDDNGVKYVGESNDIRKEDGNGRLYLDRSMQELVYQGDGFSIRIATTSSGSSYSSPYTGLYNEEGGAVQGGSDNLIADVNRVRILFDDDNPSSEVVELAMKVAGVRDPRPATEQDIELLVENRAISVLSSEGNYNNPAFTTSGANRDRIVQELRQLYPSLFDYTVATDPATGKVEIRHSQELVDALRKRIALGGGESFWHAGNLPASYSETFDDSWITESEAAAKVVLRVLGLSEPDDIGAGVPGIVSSRKRFDSGIGIEGQSSYADYGTGSAEYAYISRATPRSIQMDPTSTYSTTNYAFELDPDVILSRLDIWANETDRFGARSERDPYNEMTSFDAYEILVKGAISPSAIKKVHVGTQVRENILVSLEARGISEINGVPVEDFFVLFERIY